MIEWSVKPEIFHLGPFFLRWYGLLFMASFMLGYILFRWFLKQENKPRKYVDELIVYMFLGTVIGARLGHCFFYHPGYYFEHPLEIFALWKGGLASHGAAIGILIALYLFARKKNDLTYIWALDRVVITVALAGFFIRLGNLFNSEVIGKATQVPWAFIFTRVDRVPRHPTQLYEAFAYLIVFVFLLATYRKRSAKRTAGWALAVFLISVFTFRFLAEYSKETPTFLVAGMPLTEGQLLSIPFILLGIFLRVRVNQRK